jgi:serine/threonine protein kinase
MVHGDIKPKNIRIDARGEVRVLDFGIAKALSLSRRLTRNEFGSVPYASPERLETGDGGRRIGPVVAGGDAVRDGHRDAALPGRFHGAAGAHDPFADSAAAGARPLPGSAAEDPHEGAGLDARSALSDGA